MKQVLQDLRGGETLVVETPAPLCRPGCLRIGSTVSLVSAGTERTLVDFARGSLIAKARQQPQRVREVLQKARTDGVAATLEAVRSKLDQPMTMGYCNVGRVLEVGAGVGGFRVGDRVVSNGAHAEVVVAPANLCARIDEAVDDEAAAFAVLGAIALQGVRLAEPTLGEAFVVTGLGLVGLLAVQMLLASGCRVLGIDTDPARLALASGLGAQTADLSKGEDVLAKAQAFSRGRGVDGVLLTLSSDSDRPVAEAARMCRKRGRIVLVGVTGLSLDRADFYEKEIRFQVSCSYGPGRYDPEYEQRGRDYPFGYVRWTEQRNFEAVLDMMAAGRLDTGALVSHRFSIDQADAAYEVLAGAEPSLGILLTYPRADEAAAAPSRIELRPRQNRTGGGASLAVIGAGNYAGRVLIRAMGAAGAELHTLVSANGVSAAHHGSRQGFRRAATDAAAAIGAEGVNAVCIATRHDSHAAYTVAALEAGRSVFVEKPLCLTADQLEQVRQAFIQAGAAGPGPILMVGFNRRFAPLVVRAKGLLAAIGEPKAMVMTFNAGAAPNEHWTQDPDLGGGRLIGEACHAIDLLRHLAGAPAMSIAAEGLQRPGGPPRTDVATITLRFEDGSVGVVNYFANGHRTYPKERLEVFCAGRTLVLDNFRSLTAHGWPAGASARSWRQDKGQAACARAFVDAVASGGPPPIPPDEIFEVSGLAIEAARLAG